MVPGGRQARRPNLGDTPGTLPPPEITNKPLGISGIVVQCGTRARRPHPGDIPGRPPSPETPKPIRFVS